jgi:hypothetical protein
MTTLTIGFGRNVGTGEPLAPEDWRAFVTGMEQTALHYGEVLFVGTGRGTYDGIPEDAGSVVVTTNDPEGAVGAFTHIARCFQQEAIAVNDAPAEILEIAS